MELRRIERLSSASSNPLLRPGCEENIDIQPCQTPTSAKEIQNDREKSMPQFKSNRFHGWRFTLFLAFIAGLIVLFFNVGFLLYCFTHRENGQHLNTTLFEGDCNKSHSMDTWFHLAINVLSTALLSASNFGMQCLAAPNRRDIEEAHRNDRWLDIGVPSIRNLFRVSGVRSFLWLFLAFSSLPFHLMYNSAVYSTTSAFAYDIFAGPGALGEKHEPNLNLTLYSNNTSDIVPRLTSSFLELFHSAQHEYLHHLENQACIDAFAVSYQETYSRLLVVTNDFEQNKDTYAYINTNIVYHPASNLLKGRVTPYNWLCGTDSAYSSKICKISAYGSGYATWHRPPGNWIVTVAGQSDNQYTIKYCLAEKAKQHCKLKYSFPLVMIVIAFNLVKTIILLFVWIEIQNAPILTIGDAIASFLRYPDSNSQGSCLISKEVVKSRLQYTPSAITSESNRRPKAFDSSRARWRMAASSSRWMFGILFGGLAVVTCIVLLVFGVRKQSGFNPWKQDFGSVESRALIYATGWPSSLIGNVLIANFPQLVFSPIYFSFNSILSSMTLAAEWSSYANERKGLRVSSNPQNAQRSNYFLSIPYRYGIPLMIVSALLHWLISQSIFLVGVETWGSDGKRDKESDIMTCGWFSTGILSTIIVGSGFLLGISGLSLRRFKSGMPIAGSCSLAIAAACHPRFDPNLQHENGARERNTDVESEDEDEDMALLPVQWGAVIVNGPLGHCSFTSRHVDTPRTKGILYQ
ncbi:hypothetical protein N7456_002266 [Penicillium angulare]|uniref:DUF6536 domain-containing protein n=1 Tax=Penicillium angulare TaxID=116970 RepID=A0A9W9KQ21_9EURO|nr:hypothetical protein N7456_002266 [Penicillium angulare]